jgi:ferritin-like metal-binding protein YciE
MSDIGTNSDQSIRYDSSAADGENERHSIQTYVSDMLALERHIAQPLKRQIDLAQTKKHAAALTCVSTIQSLNEIHITALDQCLESLGGHEASGVKSAWSSLLGVGAAAIDSVRKTNLSKNLRDDYTALNLAAISYTMLYTTAVGLGNTTVADLAKRHLSDYAKIVMQITQIIPDVVLRELAEDGETVQAGAAEQIRQTSNDVWRSQSDVTH